MKISIQRETLLSPLQMVTGVIERRQNSPILANVLLSVKNGQLLLTGTDLEVEMVAHTPLSDTEEGEVTLPARKLMDICRTLPEGAQININVEKERAKLQSGRSRFTLATLPAAEFPSIDALTTPLEISIEQKVLKTLIEQTQFSMAQQDVRYYLNGLMLELGENRIKTVATDGHRLAICEMAVDLPDGSGRQVIIPRKGVGELAKLLDESDVAAQIRISDNHIQVTLPKVVFTSKLIDGKFPDYEQVIPAGCDKEIRCAREILLRALQRASVLSNEKYRGMRLQLEENLLRATVHNPEQEEAEEEVEVQYSGEPFEIGFNIAYFLEALATIKADNVVIFMKDINHSCLLHGENETNSKYVIMPMRL